jgi:ferrochelatase
MPLYPQYAAATTATACDAVFKHLMTMRWQPTLRVAPPYFDDPVYIDALAASIRDELAKLPFRPDVILASFHGIPQDYFDKGDPYYCHCAKTARLLGAALGLDENAFRMTFQSRFGPAEWLQPYTDKTVEALAQSGVKNLAIVTPGFSADCLETLEEIAVENGDIFKAHGGVNFAAIPCLNDSEQGMRVIREVVLRELKGWV